MTVAYATLIGFLSVIPIPPETGRALSLLDKPLHLCEYLLLAWCVLQAARASRVPQLQAFAGAFLFSTGYGAFLEGVQAWLPYRQAEWLDLVANTMGAGLGLVVGWRWPVASSGEP